MKLNSFNKLIFILIVPIILACMFSGRSATIEPTAIPTANPANLIDLSGKYRAEGTNPDGTTYTGEVTLIKSGTEYEVFWRIASNSYSGKGALKDKIFDVKWLYNNLNGTATYSLKDDGSLLGTWELDGQRGTENLYP